MAKSQALPSRYALDQQPVPEATGPTAQDVVNQRQIQSPMDLAESNVLANTFKSKVAGRMKDIQHEQMQEAFLTLAKNGYKAAMATYIGAPELYKNPDGTPDETVKQYIPHPDDPQFVDPGTGAWKFTDWAQQTNDGLKEYRKNRFEMTKQEATDKRLEAREKGMMDRLQYKTRFDEKKEDFDQWYKKNQLELARMNLDQKKNAIGLQLEKLQLDRTDKLRALEYLKYKITDDQDYKSLIQGKSIDRTVDPITGKITYEEGEATDYDYSRNADLLAPIQQSIEDLRSSLGQLQPQEIPSRYTAPAQAPAVPAQSPARTPARTPKKTPIGKVKRGGQFFIRFSDGSEEPYTGQ